MASTSLRTNPRRLLAAAALAVLPVAGVAASPAAAAPPPAPATRAGVTTGRVTVVGSGFGHGVGMSQYGARGMARAGASVGEILRHYYTGVEVAPYPDDVDVRVNVVHAARTMTLGSTARAAGGGGLHLVPEGDARPLVLGPADTAVVSPAPDGVAVSVRTATGTGGTVEAVASGWEVRWPGTRAVPGQATTVDVTSSGSAGRKARSYRWGSLRLTRVGAFLDAVAVLDVHGEYLRGVAEMPSSWPGAALQAQAVAARNYALDATRTTPRATCGGCQLWDDTRSQVFTGWAKESETIGSVRYGERWVDAVAATQTSAASGLTVLYQGRPVATYFAAATGGRTRDPADVWGSKVPYLASVADPWSADPAVNPSYARWTRTVPVTRLLSLFSLPDIATIAVGARDGGGAARTVTATSSDGVRRSVTGNAFTQAAGLPGAWISTLSLPAA